MVRMILAIDPGSRGGLGWCLLDRDATKVASGEVAIKLPAKSRDKTAVWQTLRRVLEDAYEASDLPGGCGLVVAYEQVQRHSSVYAAHLYGGQVAVIQQWCADYGLPFVTIPVQSVKRALGCRASGKAKDVAMPLAAQALGYDVSGPNEADALGIALAALERLEQDAA